MAEKSILFMCPHGAAKIVLAAAYFGKMMAERASDWQILIAATEPDKVFATAVVQWDDVPPPSQSLLAAKEAIIRHLEGFLGQLPG